MRRNFGLTGRDIYVQREQDGRVWFELRGAIGREVIWLATVFVLVAILSMAGPTLDWWLK